MIEINALGAEARISYVHTGDGVKQRVIRQWNPERAQNPLTGAAARAIVNTEIDPANLTAADPLAEKYYSESPYAYCGNNPARFIDPTGKEYGGPAGPPASYWMGNLSPEEQQEVGKSGLRYFTKGLRRALCAPRACWNAAQNPSAANTGCGES